MARQCNEVEVDLFMVHGVFFSSVLHPHWTFIDRLSWLKALEKPVLRPLHLSH